jgi:hypothetical protein
VGAGVCPISVKLTAAASSESPSADGRNSVAHGASRGVAQRRVEREPAAAGDIRIPLGSS